LSAISFADDAKELAGLVSQDFLDQLWVAATQNAPGRKPGQIALPNRSGNASPVAPSPAEPDEPPSAVDSAGTPAAPVAKAAGKDEWTRSQDAGARVNLFGTVEFRSKLKDAPQWERVVAVERKKPGLDNPVGLAASWAELRNTLKGQKRMDQLSAVNKFFNRYPYRTDMEVYNVQDYWATPAEFMKNSGDCEDYAITKYYALKQLGVDPDSMRIVVLVDVIRNLAHGVLAVYHEGNAYILDNLSNLVLPHTRLTHYRPHFSLNENYRWVHIVPKKK
jgi:predicted transglutaminase-like cysteine proteinase